jgi:hypothetical protein
MLHIYNIEINSLEEILKSSKESFSVDKVSPPIHIKLVRSSIEKRYVEIKTVNNIKTGRLSPKLKR